MTGNSSEKAYRVVVHGEVTGVGFRFSTVREARRYPDLKGYVRNRGPRTVECVAQGPEPDVSRFVEWVKHGPSSARVESAEVSELSPSADRGSFDVAY